MSTHVPVIIGVGEVTNIANGADNLWSPKKLMVDAALDAAADCGSEKILASLGHIVAMRLFADFTKNFGSEFGTPTNVPWSVATALGANDASLEYAESGGDVPQVALANAAARIASGSVRSALIVGAEAFRTDRRAARAGLTLDWREPGPPLQQAGSKADVFYSQDELKHGLNVPVAVYAMLDHVFRAKQSLSIEARSQAIANTLARFAQVARDTPLAVHKKGYSPGEIAAPTGDNRMIATPYTKRMIAEPSVDLGAAILLCSEEYADELEIAADKRVYLHGHAHARDEWIVSERDNLAQSPAIRLAGAEAARQAGIGLGDVAAFDIYSCFPSAVDIAAYELGITGGDQRDLTVTGGLPFFGGPGNNYVTHAIAGMTRYLRQHRDRFGMVTANGGGLTKHAVGIYSAKRPDAALLPFDAEAMQARVDQAWGSKADLSATPSGPAVIETYTIVYGREGPAKGIVFAREQSSGKRCIALLPSDPALLERLASIDLLGMRGIVTQSDGRNVFQPD